MIFKSKKEKKAFQIGLCAGLNKKKTKRAVKRPVNSKPKYLGATCVNGKFYDTNFKTPVPISNKELQAIRREYNYDGKRTDAQCVDAYVNHMRRKFGCYDRKTGKFLGLCGDK